jgi:transcriptional regulator with XRE-family HTH domain
MGEAMPEPQPLPRLGKRLGSGSVILDEEAVKHLRRAMAARGWGRRELSRISNVSPPTITNILHGRAVSAEVIARIAHALQRTPPDESVLALLEGDLS